MFQIIPDIHADSSIREFCCRFLLVFMVLTVCIKDNSAVYDCRVFILCSYQVPQLVDALFHIEIAGLLIPSLMSQCPLLMAAYFLVAVVFPVWGSAPWFR